MTAGVWALFLDGIILILLAATVFVAARLSIQLKDFRESRGALEGLIKELAVHIDKAHRAIQGLQESVRKSGDDLRGRMRDAQALADELEIILESGNNLAARIERLTEINRGQRQVSQDRVPSPRKAEGKGGLFSIRDPDYESDLTAGMKEDGTFPGEDEIDDMSGFGSRAERELFEALQHSKKEKA